MKYEFNDEEAIHIAHDGNQVLRFFQKIFDDPCIMERIPKGATIDIVPSQPGEQDAEHAAEAAEHAITSVEVGDLTVYILDLPAERNVARTSYR